MEQSLGRSARKHERRRIKREQEEMRYESAPTPRPPPPLGGPSHVLLQFHDFPPYPSPVQSTSTVSKAPREIFDAPEMNRMNLNMILQAAPLAGQDPPGDPTSAQPQTITQTHDHFSGRTISSGQDPMSFTNEPLKASIRDELNIRGETTRIVPYNEYEGVGLLRYERGSIITTDSVFDIMDTQRQYREHLPYTLDSTPFSAEARVITLPTHGVREHYDETIWSRPEREHFPLSGQRARSGRPKLVNYIPFLCFHQGLSK